MKLAFRSNIGKSLYIYLTIHYQVFLDVQWTGHASFWKLRKLVKEKLLANVNELMRTRLKNLNFITEPNHELKSGEFK